MEATPNKPVLTPNHKTDTTLWLGEDNLTAIRHSYLALVSVLHSSGYITCSTKNQLLHCLRYKKQLLCRLQYKKPPLQLLITSLACFCKVQYKKKTFFGYKRLTLTRPLSPSLHCYSHTVPAVYYFLLIVITYKHVYMLSITCSWGCCIPRQITVCHSQS